MGGEGRGGGGGVRMLHIMLCIMLHVLDLLLRCRDKDLGYIDFLPDIKKKHLKSWLLFFDVLESFGGFSPSGPRTSSSG